MAAAADKYRVEQGDPVRDRARILDLWQRCDFAAGDPAGARYDWFYLHNPRGRGRVYLLFDVADGELVGALGAGTRWFVRAAGEPPLTAAVLVDFVVHPAHRSMFPALQLQRLARETELRGSDVVYGLPDVKAAPIFKRLGAAVELESGSYVRVLRSGKYASRLLPRAVAWPARLACWCIDRARVLLLWLLCRAYGARVAWQSELPEAIDALWERAGNHAGHATGERQRTYLEWRFCAARCAVRRVLTVTGGRDGRLDAYFICSRDGAVLQVLDFLIADRDDASTRAFLALSLAAWELGVESVRVVFGGFAPSHQALFRAGYLRRDQRPCFVMTAPDAAQRPLPRHWWLTKADEDV